MTQNHDKIVLIVEDEMDMRFYLSTMVKSLGYTPLITLNGSQGLAALEKQIPNMIILDIMMPKKGGALVFQEIKADPRYNKIPVLIFSGVDYEAFIHYVKMLNADQVQTPVPKYYVEKSADPDYVKDMILRCLNDPDA
jgi:CheY-like chemotaxis protein